MLAIPFAPKLEIQRGGGGRAKWKGFCRLKEGRRPCLGCSVGRHGSCLRKQFSKFSLAGREACSFSELDR